MEQQHEFLTTTQAARLLDLSVDSVRRYEREGILSAIRVGKGQRLFEKTAVEQLAESRRNSHG